MKKILLTLIVASPLLLTNCAQLQADYYAERGVPTHIMDTTDHTKNITSSTRERDEFDLDGYDQGTPTYTFTERDVSPDKNVGLNPRFPNHLFKPN